ncbi:MAG TPA: hypothetical protein VKW78_15930 [Terriglobales bacterium]|nr:hypothetical protein [Terriglobales bacterium]
MKLLIPFLLVASVFAQTQAGTSNPGCCGGSSAGWSEMRADLQRDIEETQKRAAGMSARVLMLRNDAGSIQAFAGRDALQIDADLWQSLIDQMKLENQRRKEQLERCDTRARLRRQEKQRTRMK